MDSNVRPESLERIVNSELAKKFIDEQVALVREQVGDRKVLLALSGGVDSSVVAALLIKAIGKQLVCVHVNHGLMRKGESEQVIEVFKNQLDDRTVFRDGDSSRLKKFLHRHTGLTYDIFPVGSNFFQILCLCRRKTLLQSLQCFFRGNFSPGRCR